MPNSSEDAEINDLKDLLRRLDTDLSPTGLRLNVAVFDVANGQWLAGRHGGSPEGFGADGFVVVLPGWQKLLLAGEDGGPDLGVVLDVIQEWVINELRHGWPELQDEDGSFVALLKPVHSAGHWAWSAHGYPRAAIGDLALLPVHIPGPAS